MATANLGRVGFVNKGTYSGATAYKVNDVVVYNSGTYACIQANTGQAPTNTSYWQNWVADNAVHKTGDETIAGVKTFSNNLNFASGTRITGDFSNATTSNRVAFQTSTTNGITVVHSLPNGTGTQGAFEVNSASDIDNSTFLRMISIGGNYTALISGIRGTGTYLPMIFFTGGSERMRIDTVGNVLAINSTGLGYGIGSGGTVTQLTSKSTAVTLNKPCGRIITAADALTAGQTVHFQMTNNTIGEYDVICLETATQAGDYQISVENVTAGACLIFIKNISTITRTDPLQIRFVIIKGAIS